MYALSRLKLERLSFVASTTERVPRRLETRTYSSFRLNCIVQSDERRVDDDKAEDADKEEKN